MEDIKLYIKHTTGIICTCDDIKLLDLLIDNYNNIKSVYINHGEYYVVSDRPEITQYYFDCIGIKADLCNIDQYIPRLNMLIGYDKSMLRPETIWINHKMIREKIDLTDQLEFLSLHDI